MFPLNEMNLPDNVIDLHFTFFYSKRTLCLFRVKLYELYFALQDFSA